MATDTEPTGRRRDGLLLAVGTLTALPVPPPRAVGPAAARTAMALAPLVATVPGAAAALAVVLADAAGLGPLVAAVLALATLALVTRGLHLDGLADTADGLAASYDRQRALDVMRRGDTGPAGAATLVLVLLLQAAALAQVLSGGGTRIALVVALAAVAGRMALPVACTRGIAAARESGLGFTVAGSVGLRLTVPSVAATLLGCGLLAALAGLPWWHGVLAPAVGLLPVAALLLRARRRLGGVTGDVLGAAVELCVTAVLVTLAALG